MTYRNDLEQAHRRIEQLEGQLREAKGPPPSKKPSAVVPVVVGLLVLGIAGGVAAVFVTKKQSAAVRVAFVDEIAQEHERFEGQRMRMQGSLAAGSVVKSGEPCVLRFKLERNGAQIPVRVADCIVPDLFGKPGILVTVEGELGKEEFAATQVLVKPAF